MLWFHLNGRLVWNAETDGSDRDRDRVFAGSPAAWDYVAECHNGDVKRLYYRDGDGGRVRVINTTVHTTEIFYC